MEAFIWMFKNKDFKTHFKYLLSKFFALAILAFFIYCINLFLMDIISVSSIVFIILISIIVIILTLFPIGYFWELVASIIDREVNINVSNIYNGKIKGENVIVLPELSLKRFVWRGFASIIATLVMFLPYFLLIILGISSGSISDAVSQKVILFSLFYFLFIPALLWNYGKQNSIFAVLNIPKAVYIMGNHTFRYIKSAFLLGVIYLISQAIDKLLFDIILEQINFSLNLGDILLIVLAIIYLLLTILKDFYMIYVLAYIIGTLLPESEF